jgi:hypothetical protein
MKPEGGKAIAVIADIAVIGKPNLFSAKDAKGTKGNRGIGESGRLTAVWWSVPDPSFQENR